MAGVAVQWTPIHDMLDTDILCLSVGEQAGARKVIIQIWKAKLVRNRILGHRALRCVGLSVRKPSVSPDTEGVITQKSAQMHHVVINRQHIVPFVFKHFHYCIFFFI